MNIWDSNSRNLFRVEAEDGHICLKTDGNSSKSHTHLAYATARLLADALYASLGEAAISNDETIAAAEKLG